ncbi:MAG: endolytic transglycosylase MltG, partial [Acidimicrobiales bacterium]
SVIKALEAGPVNLTERLTVPEGYTLDPIASRLAALPGLHLSAARFLAAASTGAVRSPCEPSSSNDLEGLVFPATYDVKQGDSEARVLQEMVDRFVSEADNLGLAQGAATLGYTPYQVVIVASIVEREAKLDSDRGPVASTLYNRLKAARPLGADSTLVYALRQRNPGLDPAHVNYNQVNPYNTRANKGLPPTPISNPGIPSLQAAISPPATSYLYFVEVNPDGQLGFASTNEGFKQLTVACRAAHLC